MNGYPWLVEISGSPASEIVCYAFPHAGAGVTAVKKLCRELGDVCQAVAVRLPGREARIDEDPITDLDVACDRLAGQVAGHSGGRATVLYGHCGGGVVAYETASRLPVGQLRHLVVSAQQAPDRIPQVDAWRLPQDAFLDQVARDGYLPEEIRGYPELLDLVLPALRADYQAIECHTPSMAVIQAPLLALLGQDDRSVAVHDVVAWGRLTSVGFRLEYLSCGHNLLLERPVEVAAMLRRVID